MKILKFLKMYVRFDRNLEINHFDYFSNYIVKNSKNNFINVIFQNSDQSEFFFEDN